MDHKMQYPPALELEKVREIFQSYAMAGAYSTTLELAHFLKDLLISDRRIIMQLQRDNESLLEQLDALKRKLPPLVDGYPPLG